MDALTLISLKHQNVPGTLPPGFGRVTVHQLPVEILVQIFLFCLPSGPPFPLDPSPFASQNRASLLLCQVCSSWRRIALQTQALWTCLVLEVSVKDSQEVSERHSQAASHWFSRAGCHLVDLVVRAYVDPSEPSNHWGLDQTYFANFMMQLVRPRAERIRSLHLSFKELYDILCLLHFQNDKDALPHHVWSFPNLEYLTLDLDIFCVETVVLTALKSIPKLHTVVLDGVIISNEDNVHLPWAQLTSLTIHDIEEPIFRVLMAQCPALETGYFSMRDGESGELPTLDVTLTLLTSLTIYFLVGFNPSIFDGIHFPALDDVGLFLTCDISDPVWTAPEHMFRQLASVTKLSLGGRIAAPDMINILRATKNVTNFKVEVEDGHGEVLRALTLAGESENEQLLLPNLRVMHVRTCPRRRGSEPFSVAAFVEMVASRSPSGAGPLGVAPLRDVWVGIPPYPNTLEADVDAGLEQLGHKTEISQVRYYEEDEE